MRLPGWIRESASANDTRFALSISRTPSGRAAGRCNNTPHSPGRSDIGGAALVPTSRAHTEKRRGSNQGYTRNPESLGWRGSSDFRCNLEAALFEPRPIRMRVAEKLAVTGLIAWGCWHPAARAAWSGFEQPVGRLCTNPD